MDSYYYTFTPNILVEILDILFIDDGGKNIHDGGMERAQKSIIDDREHHTNE